MFVTPFLAQIVSDWRDVRFGSTPPPIVTPSSRFRHVRANPLPHASLRYFVDDPKRNLLKCQANLTGFSGCQIVKMATNILWWNSCIFTENVEYMTNLWVHRTDPTTVQIAFSACQNSDRAVLIACVRLEWIWVTVKLFMEDGPYGILLRKLRVYIAVSKL